VVLVVHEEELHRDHAVDERPEDRVGENARVRSLEAEDEDAVEGDRQRQQEVQQQPERECVEDDAGGRWFPEDELQEELAELDPVPAVLGDRHPRL